MKLITFLSASFLIGLFLFCVLNDSDVQGFETNSDIVVKANICECLENYTREECRQMVIDEMLKTQEKCQCTVAFVIDYTECKEQ